MGRSRNLKLDEEERCIEALAERNLEIVRRQLEAIYQILGKSKK